MEMCEATAYSCTCSLEVHAPEVPHECGEPVCQGSWNWVNDEFVVVELPGGGVPPRTPMTMNLSVPRGGVRFTNEEER